MGNAQGMEYNGGIFSQVVFMDNSAFLIGFF